MSSLLSNIVLRMDDVDVVNQTRKTWYIRGINPTGHLYGTVKIYTEIEMDTFAWKTIACDLTSSDNDRLHQLVNELESDGACVSSSGFSDGFLGIGSLSKTTPVFYYNPSVF